MESDIARAIFALMDCQHKSLVTITRLTAIVRKTASPEEHKELEGALTVAVDSFDDVLEKTRIMLEKAFRHGQS